MTNDRKFVSPIIASQTLGVNRRTLSNWADSGRIKFIRPGGENGKRLYDISGIITPTDDTTSNHPVDVIYGRVSTRKQLPNLERQITDLQSKYSGCTIIRDCASGLNFKRKGLKTILELAFEKRLRTVYIAHRDRLCRFAYDFIEFILGLHGAKIVVDANTEDPTAEQDLADDILSFITVYGARLYGKRSGSGRKRKRSNEQQTSKEGDRTDTDTTTTITT